MSPKGWVSFLVHAGMTASGDRVWLRRKFRSTGHRHCARANLDSSPRPTDRIEVDHHVVRIIGDKATVVQAVAHCARQEMRFAVLNEMARRGR
jgi:hypothetical protein